MKILGLDHVQLAIPAGGEEKARAFYGDLLGMTEVPKPETLSQSGCWFESGPLHLHLGVDPDFLPATKAHPAFLVDDLELSKVGLLAAGFAVNDDKPVPGYVRFFTSDPFGNRLEFMQKT
ncbi:VOC family protein [Altererythrobacter sp. MF3-039]|uniref:VOC family protein n=1 Tax=Altererythrobacter sp. MF3-039 TaxID=3252901 RepID=UPI00390C9D65